MGSKKRKNPVVRTVTSLFSTIKIQDNPHKRTPEDYYKTMWLKKKHHTGIEIIAKAQHSISFQKAQIMDTFKSNNISFTESLFKNRGPDIIARTNNIVWKLECKGIGEGSPQTLRNNFDRAVASAVSYFDSPGTRIGLALANDYLWVLKFGQRLPRTLREAANMWVLLLENGTIYPYEPTEDLPFHEAA